MFHPQCFAVQPTGKISSQSTGSARRHNMGFGKNNETSSNSEPLAPVSGRKISWPSSSPNKSTPNHILQRTPEPPSRTHRGLREAGRIMCLLTLHGTQAVDLHSKGALCITDWSLLTARPKKSCFCRAIHREAICAKNGHSRINMLTLR